MPRESSALYWAEKKLLALWCTTEGITHTAAPAIKIASEGMAAGGCACLSVLLLYFILCPRCFTDLKPKAVWKILPTHRPWWLKEGKLNNPPQHWWEKKVKKWENGAEGKWKMNRKIRMELCSLISTCNDVLFDKCQATVLSGSLKHITSITTSVGEFF